MTRHRYQLWTPDMVIGAAIVIIGIVATLVRGNWLVFKWNVPVPPMVVHLWPVLLIGIGVLLLFDHEEQAARNAHPTARAGERQ